MNRSFLAKRDKTWEQSPVKRMIGIIIAAFLWPTMAHAQPATFAEKMWTTAKRTDMVGITDECRQAPTSVVEFYKCGKTICGRIVALNPRDNQLPMKNLSSLTDELNPCVGVRKKSECAEIRSRSIIGLTIFKNIRKAGRFWVGDAYDACQGKYGQICIWWRTGSRAMVTKGCQRGFYNCDGFFANLNCTKQYTYRQVDDIPDGWVNE